MSETVGWAQRWARAVAGLRGRMRGRRGGVAVAKIVVGIVGTGVLLAGVSMLVLPGPGWATIVAGLAILSTEFRWAAVMRRRLVAAIVSAGTWIGRQPRWVRWLTWLAVGAVIVAAGYVSLMAVGVPGWLWDPLQRSLERLPLIGG